MMLVTTSRKPGQLTRAVARTLASALGAEYLNRGKGGLASVLVEAEKVQASKILFVWERFGNPSRLVGFDMQKADQLQAEDEKRVQEQKAREEAEEDEKDVTDPRVTPYTLKKPIVRSKKPEKTKEKPENENEEESGQDPKSDSSTEVQTPWLKPEVGIHGIVFNRQAIRHKGSDIQLLDPFGERVAALLEAQKGPNQIVLSRFGLKVFNGTNLVLELKFR